MYKLFCNINLYHHKAHGATLGEKKIATFGKVSVLYGIKLKSAIVKKHESFTQKL